MNTGCGELADVIVAAMESGRCGAVRQKVSDHVAGCGTCVEHAATLEDFAIGLDPPMPVIKTTFVGRVVSEIRGQEIVHASAKNRLPPLWQLLGTVALLGVLSTVVFATGSTTDAWHERALTGFLNQTLITLADLGEGLRVLWDSAAPGKGLTILIACTGLATMLNLTFLITALRSRHRANRREPRG